MPFLFSKVDPPKGKGWGLCVQDNPLSTALNARSLRSSGLQISLKKGFRGSSAGGQMRQRRGPSRFEAASAQWAHCCPSGCLGAQGDFESHKKPCDLSVLTQLVSTWPPN